MDLSSCQMERFLVFLFVSNIFLEVFFRSGINYVVFARFELRNSIFYVSIQTTWEDTFVSLHSGEIEYLCTHPIVHEEDLYRFCRTQSK